MWRHPRVGLLIAQAHVVVGGSAPARADFDPGLAVSVIEVPAGLFRYDYTLTNRIDSTLPATDFFLEIDPDAALRVITNTADGEVDYTPGNSSVAFNSAAAEIDLLAGSSARFSLTIPLLLGTVAQAIRGLDLVRFTEVRAEGVTLGPLAVPEPVSLVLLTLGTMVLVGLGRQLREPA